MQPSDVLWMVKELGFAGALLAFLFWSENNNRKDRNKREERHADERRERLDADRAETESRRLLAASLAALATIITGKPNV